VEAHSSRTAQRSRGIASAWIKRSRSMKFRYILPAVYLVIAVAVWVDFMRSPPDGLANAGLMLVVLPVTLLDLALRRSDAPEASVFMPDGLSYYPAHTVFFGISVACIAVVLWLLGLGIDRLRAR
jgi:hypothetical protein